MKRSRVPTLWALSCCLLFLVAGVAQAQIASNPLTAFVDRYLDDWYKRHPGAATMDGIHENDGVLDPMSAAAIASEVTATRNFQRELSAIGTGTLTPEQQIDFQILDNHLQAKLYNLETVRMWERSPLLYSDLISNALLPLILFEYAPAETRLKAVISRERAIPRLLAEARENLKHVPKVFTDPLGVEYFDGTRKFIEQDIPEAFKGVQDPALKLEFQTVTAQAGREIASFLIEIRGQMASQANGDYALGSEAFAVKLRLEEGIEIPLDRLFELAKRHIDRSHAEFQSIVSKLYPGTSPLDAWKKLRDDYPAEGTLVQTSRESLGTLIEFIKKKGIVSLPTGPLPTIQQTPKFLSSNTFAAVYSPGVFEKTTLPAVYYVTDVEPEWSAEEKRQHLREYAWPIFWTLTIHEAIPGHYVQGVAMRNAPSKVRMAAPFVSYALQEGWAHYCEQMIIDEGFRQDDPTIRLGLLKDGLVRLCRWYAGIGLHTGRMTVDQAVEFFKTEAFMEDGPARDEALRGTYDPQYILYSIGKLALFKLCDDERARLGKAFSLKEFHDRVLSQGNSPIWVLRRTMLPATAWPAMLGD